MARLREGEPARDAEVQPVARACADSVEWGDSLCGRAGRRGRGEYPEHVSARPMATRTAVESHRTRQLMPNVRAKLPAEAGAVSPVRDDANAGTDRAYSACRSGSGVERGVRPRRPETEHDRQSMKTVACLYVQWAIACLICVYKGCRCECCANQNLSAASSSAADLFWNQLENIPCPGVKMPLGSKSPFAFRNASQADP